VTPQEFMWGYLKLYEEYMQRKEHLIEVATTLYSAFALTLLLQKGATWSNHWLVLPAFGGLVGAVVWWFVRWQFRFWSDGALICNASQTVAAEWLGKADVPAEELAPMPLPSLRGKGAGVKGPTALAREMGDRITKWNRKTWCEKRWDSPLENVVEGVILLWLTAFLVRVFLVTDGWLSVLSCLRGGR